MGMNEKDCELLGQLTAMLARIGGELADLEERMQTFTVTALCDGFGRGVTAGDRAGRRLVGRQARAAGGSQVLPVKASRSTRRGLTACLTAVESTPRIT